MPPSQRSFRYSFPKAGVQLAYDETNQLAIVAKLVIEPSGDAQWQRVLPGSVDPRLAPWDGRFKVGASAYALMDPPSFQNLLALCAQVLGKYEWERMD